MMPRISLAWKFSLAFLAVFAVTLAAVLFALEQATTESFHAYLDHSQMMRGMMADARSMMGPTEQDFIRRLRWSLLLAGIAGAGAAAAAGFLLARYIAAPLRALAAASRGVAAGDLSNRVPEGGNDEIADVAAAFNHMAAALARQDEERRRFMADVAHELRTPLAVLQAEIEALQDGVTEASADRLASLHDEIDLLSRLVQDLRTLSLAEAGELALTLVEQDPADLLQRAVNAVAVQAGATGVDIRLDMAEPLPAVTADADRISQVLHNLLSNALRHARREVVVSASAANQRLRVCVRDDGPGIPADALPHVFDRFYRADPARSRATGGSGLGLAIARQIVLAHGGSITAANNEPPPGAAFTFELPVAAGVARGELLPLPAAPS